MTLGSYRKFAALAIAGIGSALAGRAHSNSGARRSRLRARPSSIAGFLILAAITVDLQAQRFVTLASFTGVGGAGPVGPLVQGTDGSFYGVTESGGTNNYGTVFKMTPGGALKTLYSFGTAATDGYFPVGGLVQGTDGNFYGVTKYNPILACCGTIFRITPNGAFTTIHTFGLNDGTTPAVGLILGSDGNFYGTTGIGGVNGGATIFKVSPAGALTVLYSFTLLDQGDYALTGVVQGGDANFYGTTNNGGPYSDGSAFEITPAGTFSTVYAFADGYESTGNNPSPLVTGADGNVYGITSDGGTNGGGTFFRLTPGGNLTTVYNFQTNPSPRAKLALASDGNFYGSDGFTLFSITPAGTVTTLYTFGATDGEDPDVLMQGTDGNLYGVMNGGGAHNAGTIFRFTLPGSQPSITSGGVVPVYSSVPTVQSGEWVSVYGANLASSTASWNGNFPTTLGTTSVTIDGKPAYLWFVSPTQINLQVPDDTTIGSVPVVVTTAGGTFTSNVSLAQFAPSFSLLDSKHVAGIIARSDGSGAYGGGTYDIIGPTGTSLGYQTVAAKAGDSVSLFAVGLGPTNPVVPAGRVFSGAAGTTHAVTLTINNTSVIPTFAGLIEAGLYQINLTVPAGLGSGDLPLLASMGGAQTPTGVVISLQ